MDILQCMARELVPRITTWVPPRSQHLRMYSGEFSAPGMNLWRLIFESNKGQLESPQDGNERDGCAYVFILAVCRLVFVFSELGWA